MLAALVIFAAIVMAVGCPPAAPLAVVVVINAHIWNQRAKDARVRHAQAQARALARHRQEQFRAIRVMSSE